MGILSNNDNTAAAAVASGEEKIRVKVTLGEETRRASCPLPSFAALYDLTRALFHSRDLLVFTYVDDMGDKITMSSDIELFEALRISSSLPNQTLILVAVAHQQPKEGIVEAEGCVQAPTASQDYPFFNQYSIPRGVYGKLSDIKDSGAESVSTHNGPDFTNTVRVHHSTIGTFSTVVEAKPQQVAEEVEIDLVEAPQVVIGTCAPLSPLATTSLLSVPVPTTVALPTPSLSSLPLSSLPVLLATPVVQQSLPKSQAQPQSTPKHQQKQRRHAPSAVFESSPLDGIDDLDLYRAHKEYKEKKRALKKKDARKKELAKKHHRKSKDY